MAIITLASRAQALHGSRAFQINHIMGLVGNQYTRTYTALRGHSKDTAHLPCYPCRCSTVITPFLAFENIFNMLSIAVNQFDDNRCYQNLKLRSWKVSEEPLLYSEISPLLSTKHIPFLVPRARVFDRCYQNLKLRSWKVSEEPLLYSEISPLLSTKHIPFLVPRARVFDRCYQNLKLRSWKVSEEPWLYSEISPLL